MQNIAESPNKNFFLNDPNGRILSEGSKMRSEKSTKKIRRFSPILHPPLYKKYQKKDNSDTIFTKKSRLHTYRKKI